MTLHELYREIIRRLEVDLRVEHPPSNPRVTTSHQDDHASFDELHRMSLDGRPFVSWSSPFKFSDPVWNVVWHFDEIGQPDLSFKGINKFKGRWEGETA